jgi:hypothetical protein
LELQWELIYGARLNFEDCELEYRAARSLNLAGGVPAGRNCAFPAGRALPHGSLGGFAISAPGIAWSAQDDSERKVLLWSRTSWRDVQLIDALEVTGSAITGLTSLGKTTVRVVGLCIPYHFANPLGQHPRAKMWSQHERFLQDLQPLLNKWRQDGPVIVVGDFNRRIPRAWGPKRSYALLEDAFEHYEIVTSGVLDGISDRAIDHIAFSGGFSVRTVFGRPAETSDARKRSDHFGVFAEFDPG